MRGLYLWTAPSLCSGRAAWRSSPSFPLTDLRYTSLQPVGLEKCPYFFIFQRYPILGFNILNDAEVLLLNNSAFTNDTRRTPTVQIVQNPVSNTICNDFSSLPSLEVGKTDMRALYPTRQHLQYVVMYIKYGPEGFIKKYKMFMIN